MNRLFERAWAKINLTLSVVDRRPDGYHNLDMIMQTVSLCDDLTIHLGAGGDDRVKTNLPYLPSDDTNLALRAARLFFEGAGIEPGGVAIEIIKRIPVCAGLGGGSADAAAVLRALWRAFPGALSEEKLFSCALELGSDVPYCVRGGTAAACGRGEKLRALPPIPDCLAVLCKPDVQLNTKRMFALLDQAGGDWKPVDPQAERALCAGDLEGLARAMANDFEPVAFALHPQIAQIKRTLLQSGALGACMSGSGPTVFGLFLDKQAAQRAYERLRARHPATFFTAPCGPETV